MSAPKPRLGKGLSGLLAKPVAVSPDVVATQIVETTDMGAGAGGSGQGGESGKRKAESGKGEKRSTEAVGAGAGDSGQLTVDSGQGGESGKGEKRSTEAVGGGAGAPTAQGSGRWHEEVGGTGLRRIAVGAIGESPYQPRTVMDDVGLESLAASIKQSGVMQPIAVRPKADSGQKEGVRWEIVAGERRWRAAKLAGLAEIPALVVELDDRGAAEWAIVENVQREDLNPMDRAAAFDRLISEFGVTQAEVAERVGIERSSVANALRLLELEGEIAELVAMGGLSAGHAKALLGGPRGEGRVKAARAAAREGWSVRAVEGWAERAMREAEGRGGTDSLRESVARASGRDPREARLAHIAALEKQLGGHLGTKVRVKTDSVGKKGRIQIEFYSLEHFEGLMERMGFRMES